MSIKFALLIFALSFMTHTPCGASSISIVDTVTAFPFIRSVENANIVLQWDSGTTIQLLSSCKLIRVTRRGIRCIPASMSLVKGWETMFTRMGQLSERCLPHRQALCIIGNATRLFPTDVVFVADSSVAKCVHGQGRRLVPDRNISNSLMLQTNTTSPVTRDDISLCDIVDTNLDVVYDPVHNQVFAKQLNNSATLYVSISILILLVVVLMAEAVNSSEHTKLSHNIIAWVLLVSLSILMLFRVDDRMHPIITTHDQIFIGFIIVYITISTSYWVMTYRCNMCQQTNKCTTSLDNTNAPNASYVIPIGIVAQPKDVLQSISVPIGTHVTQGEARKVSITKTSVCETQRDGINSMLASIQLGTCVLYGTADNVYVAAIFFVLLFRCMQKLHAAHYNPAEWTIYANTVIVMDVTYTALVFLFAVLPHYDNLSDTVLYTAAQYVICDTVASNAVLSNAIAAYQAAASAVTTEHSPPNKSNDGSKVNISKQENVKTLVNSVGPANSGPGSS